MSSTNRGAIRQPDDLYVTPSWAAKVILPHLGAPIRVLDPACGSGALLNAARDYWGGKVQLYGLDIEDRGWPLTEVRDSLSMEIWPQTDLIFANFPYSFAMEFVLRSLREAGPNRTVASLMRLSWMCGKERAAFHRKHASDVYTLSRRPCFTGHLKWQHEQCSKRVERSKAKGKPKRCQLEAGHDGECMVIGTDSCEYAWFVWGPGRGGRWFPLDCGD